VPSAGSTDLAASETWRLRAEIAGLRGVVPQEAAVRIVDLFDLPPTHAQGRGR